MIGLRPSKRTDVEDVEFTSESNTKKRKVDTLRRSSRNIQPVDYYRVVLVDVVDQEENNNETKDNNQVMNSAPFSSDDEVDLHAAEMSDYEKLRRKNIEENKKMFAAIFQDNESIASLMPGSKKTFPRVLKREKKPTTHIARRPPSLRLQRISPNNKPLPDIPEMLEQIEKYLRKPLGPLDMIPQTLKHEEKENLALDFTKCIQCLKHKCSETIAPDFNNCRCVEALKSLRLTQERIAKVVPQRIFSVAVHPSVSKTLVCAGDKWGHLGIWDVPHSRTINCLKFAPEDSGKLFCCSYDGTLRCGDLNKQVFHEVYATNSEDDISLSYFDFLSPDGSELLVSQNTREGFSVVVDQRAKKSPIQKFKLHDRIVRSISIHPLRKNYFITASTDTTVALWDVRMLKGQGKNKPLSCLLHTRTVKSALFSPVTGSNVLTTSLDDKLRIASCSNGDGSVLGLTLRTSIRHNNQTGRWLTSFCAQWHPQLEDVFVVGSMNQPRRIEMFSTDGNILHNFLNEDYLGSVCSVNAFHPSRNILVGGNSSGRVHVFM